MADISRRWFTVGIAGAGFIARAARAASAPTAHTAWDFSFPDIEGGTLALSTYKGRVLLVVNTASFCGYTYQYEGLEKLYSSLSGRGLTVVGVPSGDFFQESGDNAKVKKFCETTFDVRFPMAAILPVRGSDATPFYAWVRAQRDWQPTWNFNKVLIGRDGLIKGTYRSTVEPTSRELLDAIEAELAKPSPVA